MASAATLGLSLFRRKPVRSMAEHAAANAVHGTLSRSIGLFPLVMLGIGATVGSGIFVALTAAVPVSGPSVILSFVIAGITAGLTALCYAELSSTMPVSGSAYSYAYATLGEFSAFVVGACLLLEYAVSASAIAVGWGQYLNELFGDVTGWRMPDAISQPPGEGGVVNLPAVALIAICATLLIRGTRESTTVNAILVAVKLGVLALFVVIALTAFRSENLIPFMPLGWSGIGTASAMIFFSYIGLDTISTAGDEAKDPARTLPLAIVISLLVVTAIYLLVAIAAVGAQPWTAFSDQNAGLAVILRNVTGATWPSILFSIGAIVSIFSVTLAAMFGQTRILMAMSRDGLLPTVFGKVDPATQSPRYNTYIVATFIAVLAAVVPLDVLVNLTSMGTLTAFAVVSLGVMILRRTRPDLERGFKVPLYPFVPVASVAFCLYLIIELPRLTHLLFLAWVTGALLLYFSYSFRNSVLAKPQPAGSPL
ncbi:APC family permease [Kaistia terrae]|uniref:APC family permease n=1 Tax=Kaistia terrae TaxID=537017 RepID=A0ABW0Q2K1_9HYPH|nr:amino acid permease [Kaistia terrae]MCX5581598.1 amino acid permease [Kaistia terrae]